MDTVRIQNGQAERIRAFIFDNDGNAIVGLSNVFLKIYRESDGKFYTGSTWQLSSAAIIMVEEDAANKPGWYYYNFDTSGLSDDVYYLEVSCASAMASYLAAGELKAGGYVDNIDAAASAIKAKTDNLPANPASETGALAKEATLLSLDMDIKARLDNAAYGLSALQALLNAIDTSTELQARFDEIKGAGWANESLKAIKTLIETLWDEVLSGHLASGSTGKKLSEMPTPYDVGT